MGLGIRILQLTLFATLLIGASPVAAQTSPAGAADSSSSAPAPKPAPDAAGDPSERWAVHVQSTLVVQAHPAFRSPYRGANSLDPAARGDETFDATLFAGLRLGPRTEVWINPEIDQGFGISNTLGVAAFPSGEAYKVGASTPYLRLQRLFVRHSIDLNGDVSPVDADLNQLKGQQASDRVVITVGKFSVGDVFDTNRYAHDPRGDFLNWALIDTGSFDYAADAWGYSIGASAEWYTGAWTLRAGLFDLSLVPNSKRLDPTGHQFQTIAEVERRFGATDNPTRVKLTGFLTRGRMGRFADAIALAQSTGAVADTGAVRDYASRVGVGLSVEHPLSATLGLFSRLGWADGSKEPYEFADIDRTFALGLSSSGKAWGRPDDTAAVAGVIDAISKVHQQYLAAGGLGILIGDGALSRPAAESVLEAYYTAALSKHLKLTGDYQFVANPAYNRDRGPVSVVALRLHLQY